MAFWNRKRDETKYAESPVDRLTRVILSLREDNENLRREVYQLQVRVEGHNRSPPMASLMLAAPCGTGYR
ncbi:MAG: hypothetical protein ACYTAO_03585 [Planctomycetota bacterium]|jgi:hypothetical protein